MPKNVNQPPKWIEKHLRSMVDSRWNEIGPTHCPTCGAPQPDYEIHGGTIVCSHCQTKIGLIPTDEHKVNEATESGVVTTTSGKSQIIGGLFCLLVTIIVAYGVFTSENPHYLIGIPTVLLFGFTSITAIKNGIAVIVANKNTKK